MGTQVACKRCGETVDRQLLYRYTLRAGLRDRRDGIEGDVEAPLVLENGRKVIFNFALIEGVDFR